MFRRYLYVGAGADERDDHDIPPVVIDFDESGIFAMPFDGELALTRSTDKRDNAPGDPS